MRWPQREPEREPELFTIVVGRSGAPWTINGESAEVQDVRGATDRVFSLATRFPVRMNVLDGEDRYTLEMDRKRRIQAIEDTEDTEEPQEEPAASPAVVPAAPVVPAAAPVITEAEDITPAGNVEDTAHAEPAPLQDTEDTDRSRRLITPMRVAGIAALVTVVVVSGVLASQGSDDDQGTDADTTAQEPEISLPTPALEGWRINNGQSAVSIIGDQVVTVEDTTVRFLNAETGRQSWETVGINNAAQARSLNGTAASAVDLGEGQVAVLADGEVSVLRGALNARGTEPVIISDRDYTTAEGTTRPLTDTQAVLGAIDQGVVLFDSPNRILVEGNIAQLATPEAEATITQAIRVTDERAVMVWSRGDTRWLVTHDLVTGRVQLEEEIGADEVTVRSGVVWIGSDRTLVGDEIESVCDDGEQVNATIICPTPDGWETFDGTQQYLERPTAVSPSYTVTAGTVTTQRNTP